MACVCVWSDPNNQQNTAKEAIIIDPVDLTVDRDIQVAEEMDAKLVCAVYVQIIYVYIYVCI